MVADNTKPPPRNRNREPATRTITRIELPAHTIAKVILTAALLWLLYRLWSLVLMTFVSLLLAAALDPAVRRMQRRGLGRTSSVAVVFVILNAAIVLVIWLLVPPLITESRAFADDAPRYIADGRQILNQNPELYVRLQSAAGRLAKNPGDIASRFITIGTGVISGIADALIVMVLTIYFLIDGDRIYAWTFRYLPARHRDKLDRTIPEVSKVVSGYVAGQLLTSAALGIYTYIFLSVAHVPQPLFLAILAAFADAIPLAGVFIAMIPAVLLALTVSVWTAVFVIAAHTLYSQLESYLIAPRIYRDTLKISSFAVFIAVLIGARLLGIIGVLLALPVAATVPVIQRIWIEEDHPGQFFGPADEALPTDP